jgi:peptidoglycan hydrolase-like protein with peptidoglycan-binding domain
VQCGIQVLDRVLSDAGAPPIPPDARDAVAAVQALLLGHGYEGLPTLLASACGMFGPRTADAVRHFQTAQRLEMTGTMDTPTVRGLVTLPARSPIASRVYLACVLDLEFSGLLRLATVTMQLEGGGYFGASNWNTDRCGLSFGLIQWAQRPGRLHELLACFDRADTDRFSEVFGGGDRQVAQGLLLHTAKPNGGVDPATGRSLDPHYELINQPWRDRFRAAGSELAFQRAQVAAAVTAFTASARQIKQTMPLVATERGLVFMLDVANQFGDGGAHRLASQVPSSGVTEAEFLLAIERQSIAAVARQYGTDHAATRSTANRRALVRTTPWLTDAPAAWT